MKCGIILLGGFVKVSRHSSNWCNRDLFQPICLCVWVEVEDGGNGDKDTC